MSYFILGLLISSTLVMAAEGSQEDPLQKEEKLVVIKKFENVDKQSFLKEYYDLFLDPFDQNLLKTENEKAKQYAVTAEKSREKELNSLGYNSTLSDRERRFMQDRQGLESTAKFSPFYFRMYSTNPELLIETYEEEIQLLKTAESNREKRKEDLSEKQEYGEPLIRKRKNDIEKEINKLKTAYTKLMKFDFDQKREIYNIKMQKKLIETLSVKRYISKLSILFVKIQNNFEKYTEDQNLKSFETFLLQSKEELDGAAHKIKYHPWFQYVIEGRADNYTQGFINGVEMYRCRISRLINDIEKYIHTDPNERLEDWERLFKEEYGQLQENFEKHTEELINLR